MNKLIACLLLAMPVTATQLNVGAPAPLEYLVQLDEFKKFNKHLTGLGYSPSYQYLPSERSLIELNSGALDLDFANTAVSLTQYPNIIQMTKPILTAKIVAFYLKTQVQDITQVEQLAPYNVGYLTGWKAYGKVAAFGKHKTAVSDIKRLVRMLMARRIDMIITEAGFGGAVAAALEYDVDKFAESNVLVEQPMYILLHKKHRPLQAKLAQEVASWE